MTDQPVGRIGLNHIRNERATREHYALLDHDAPLRDLVGVSAGVSWCGVDTRETGDTIWFQDIDHALIHLKYQGDISACHACLAALRIIIDRELQLPDN